MNFMEENLNKPVQVSQKYQGRIHHCIGGLLRLSFKFNNYNYVQLQWPNGKIAICYFKNKFYYVNCN